jgi:cyclic pyranopterin phosphate synthase
LGPIKINTVVKKNLNEDEILDLVERFSNRNIAIRFIEYMDVGTTNGWSMGEVVTAEEIRAIIGINEQIAPDKKSDVAKRYRLAKGGEVGIISSVTEPFCGDCTRARLSADGRLFTCLFSSKGTDLLTMMRDGLTDVEIAEAIEMTWGNREDRYSELRSEQVTASNRIEMSFIGG